ncbi:MAG: hypothetical protein C5B59_13810 [Bacteroidetes bacterium]|nr:MAG: hypothetical protein C5B59_13810 [Bacteroidota bacterium]
MKKKLIQSFLLSALLILLLVNPLAAQHYVRDKPALPPPSRTKPAMPYKDCVWIKEDWKWTNGTYVWYGDRWARPPYDGATWIPGHWHHGSHGWNWIAGQWRMRPN